jgi:selenocysteine lyase/cysteine desulfurase
VITSDEEHPGLIGPLVHARARGASVRAVPLREVADAVGPRTRLVAVSHVSWVGGDVAPDALAEAGVPVVLDGAQGAGAVPVDVRALGCSAYAAAGQKWLCGADGTGLLWIDPAFAERVRVVSPSYVCFADVTRGLDSELKDTAGRFDTASLSREAVSLSLAAFQVLEEAGWEAVYGRAAEQAARLAEELAARGREVAPRGRTTLVSWSDPDAEATRDRLAAAGVVVRNLPGRGLVRASVGAWNDANDLDRLLDALG